MRVELNALAVDDDEFIRELLPVVLAQIGIQKVTLAPAADVALKIIQEDNVLFDCFLLDIEMPGMSGIELCKRIRQLPKYRLVPIIMLTAVAGRSSVDEAYAAGATDYLSKPIDVDSLGTSVRNAVKMNQARL